jgi:hypothetical protein
MKAIQLSDYGPVTNLTYATLSLPEARPESYASSFTLRQSIP